MSWITNDTAAISGERIAHAEVLESGDEGTRSLGALIAAFLRARGAA
jgi:purine nucleoside phosphorylase